MVNSWSFPPKSSVGLDSPFAEARILQVSARRSGVNAQDISSYVGHIATADMAIRASETSSNKHYSGYRALLQLKQKYTDAMAMRFGAYAMGIPKIWASGANSVPTSVP